MTHSSPLRNDSLPPSAESPVRRGFEEMHLGVGNTLHLELTHLKGQRATVQLIGWLKGHSLIVTAPSADRSRFTLKEGDLVLARAFTGRSAFAFRATILRVANVPYSHLYLTFPDNVESVDVRRSPRCRTNLSATALLGAERKIPAQILNLSMHGALLETREALAADQDTIRLAFTVSVHGSQVSLEIESKVLSAKGGEAPELAASHQYAVSFQGATPAETLAIGGYVFYQIYELPANVI